MPLYLDDPNVLITECYKREGKPQFQKSNQTMDMSHTNFLSYHNIIYGHTSGSLHKNQAITGDLTTFSKTTVSHVLLNTVDH